MTAATVTLTPPMPGDPARCVFLTARGQCRRTGTSIVLGVEHELCVQHARIVATQPGAGGVVRRAPRTVEEVIADLNAVVTVADLKRCTSAICRHVGGDCYGPRGLKPEVHEALRRAKARLAHGGPR